MEIRAYCATLVFGLLFGLLAGNSDVHAQQLSLENIRAAVANGDVQAKRQLGEALVFGLNGATQNISEGLAMLEEAVAANDLNAKALLGKLLLEGYVVPSAPDRGAQLLEEAIGAGHVEARTTLGQALLWGVNREKDPRRAETLLEEAAEGGDLIAVRVLGQNLLGGRVLDQDVDRGIALLEQAGAADDTRALVSLGKHYLNRSRSFADQARARDYFENAAQLGDGEGLRSYGSFLMWNEVAWKEAEDYLRRAGELGVDSAWTTLASGAMFGYLGPKSRSKFDEFAERGRAVGQERIAVLQAQRQMWGISMKASGPETLAGLEAEAASGNAEAARYLIRLVRDGNRLNIRKDRKAARNHLEQFAKWFSPIERRQLEFSIAVSSTRKVADFVDLAEAYRNQPELRSVAFGEDLYKANPNFAFYLLQRMMRENGTYIGAINGFATATTLRSAYIECRTLINPERCDDNVMRADVIGALIAR